MTQGAQLDKFLVNKVGDTIGMNETNLISLQLKKTFITFLLELACLLLTQVIQL